MRENLIEEAASIIKRITDYSPKTGERLRKELVSMSGICATTDDKDSVMDGTGTVIDEEVKNGESNVDDIKELKKIHEESKTVKCGGP
ncbi:MAG: hypothetical protein GY941_23675 [Planctomycetes bacterium]|nr:hypothetical protein [Planctomycetota bacterium]